MRRRAAGGLAVTALAAVAAAACFGDVVAPADPRPERFVEVATGRDHTCAVSAEGRTYCWGRAGQSRLGHDGRDRVCDERGCQSPVAIIDAVPLRLLAAGEAHTCGIDDDGLGYCWGYGRFGQLGDAGHLRSVCEETEPFFCTPAAFPVSIGFALKQITAANMHTCALTEWGALLCWGWNLAGQLGTGEVSDQPHPVPRRVQGGGTYLDVSTGPAHTCAVRREYVPYCWGANEKGRLGTGNLTWATAPVPVAGDHRFTDVDVGTSHSCGIDEAGGLWCWGWGSAGRLGTGSQADQLAPAPVLVPEPVTGVSAGHTHTCAIGETGTLYCWGANDVGQLGVGDRTNRLVPTVVALPAPTRQVSAGRGHTCAITDEQRLYCWGSNSFRQLGDGSVHSKNEPVAINP